MSLISACLSSAAGNSLAQIIMHHLIHQKYYVVLHDFYHSRQQKQALLMYLNAVYLYVTEIFK